MQLARQAKLIVTYDNIDITGDLAPYLLSAEYTDQSSAKADDLQITLEDRAGLWRGDWLPQKGATLQATIQTKNWQLDGQEETLPCGTFEIDEIECSGSPDVVTIKAASVPDSIGLRGVDRTKAWEKTQLTVIAREIAQNAGLELLFESDDIPEYDRTEQTEQSDLSFLMKLCEDAGLALKITGTQIVIFDEEKYEQADPVMTIVKGESWVKSYSITSSTRDVYTACAVKYHDAATNQTLEYVYTPLEKANTAKTLRINERIDSIAKAEKLAKSKLRQKNKEETKMSLSLIGCTKLVGGVTVMVEGWGKFDGKYFVTDAKHSISGGYSASINIRRCLSGY